MIDSTVELQFATTEEIAEELRKRTGVPFFVLAVGRGQNVELIARYEDAEEFVDVMTELICNVEATPEGNEGDDPA